MLLTNLDKLLIAAAFTQIALTLGLMLWLGFLRVGALNRRQVQLKDIALSNDKYPEQAKKAGNSFANQFQLPVLFYFLVVLQLIVGDVGWPDVVLACGFVVLRYAHAFVHTTSNNLRLRFSVFLLGLFVLCAYLALLLVRLIFQGVF